MSTIYRFIFLFLLTDFTAIVRVKKNQKVGLECKLYILKKTYLSKIFKSFCTLMYCITSFAPNPLFITLGNNETCNNIDLPKKEQNNACFVFI